MELDFQTVDEKYSSYEETFKKIVETASDILSIKADLVISVSIIHADLIHQINRDYRHIDRPTDVISFAFLDNEKDRESILKKPQMVALGDIYICIEKAISQAEEYGHSLNRELCFLFTHGLLHLLGYDHMQIEDEKKMFEMQDIILEKLGVTK